MLWKMGYMNSSSSVTLLTVSKRTGWEEKARQSVASQTLQPDEWVIVTECYEDTKVLSDVATVIKAPPKTKFSNLNASLNEGMRHCKCKHVVFYQDFIDLEPDTIEKLVEASSISGFIGTLTINDDGSLDGRYQRMDCLRPCEPGEWEANVAIAPLKVLYELGGFDEDYDNGWSWDNVNVAERAKMLGHRFYLDETIRPQLLYHKKEPAENLNGDRHATTMEKIRNGELPIKLDYLV